MTYDQWKTASPYDEYQCGVEAEELKEVFADYNSPWHLYRSTYKYTDCGPAVGMEIDGKTLWCSDLPGEWKGIITMIAVGSIVEGVDEGCQTIEIWLTEDKELKEIAEEYWDAVERVDKEAKNIWNDTHGCEGCAELFGADEFDLVPIHTDCKQCGGHGIII
jgi:hypothetical protein